MGNQMNICISDYTVESRQTSAGKLKEVFCGTDEIDHFIGKKEGVGSVVVHHLPPHGAFDVTFRANRIFYAWGSEVEVMINSEAADLKEDHKIFIRSSAPVTIGNKSSQRPNLVIEVSSFPFSLDLYKTVGEGDVKHMPAISDPMEIREFLGGKLEQITVYNVDPYFFGGNHYHTDRRKELFLVAEGLVHVFERRVDRPNIGFTIEEILERIKSQDIDFAIYYDTFPAGGAFSFDTHESELRLSHATAAGEKGAKFIELSNVAFDPEHYEDSTKDDILIPANYSERKKLIDCLAK